MYRLAHDTTPPISNPSQKRIISEGKLKKETREGEKRSFQKGKNCASREK